MSDIIKQLMKQQEKKKSSVGKIADMVKHAAGLTADYMSVTHGGTPQYTEAMNKLKEKDKTRGQEVMKILLQHQLDMAEKETLATYEAKERIKAKYKGINPPTASELSRLPEIVETAKELSGSKGGFLGFNTTPVETTLDKLEKKEAKRMLTEKFGMSELDAIKTLISGKGETFEYSGKKYKVIKYDPNGNHDIEEIK